MSKREWEKAMHQQPTKLRAISGGNSTADASDILLLHSAGIAAYCGYDDAAWHPFEVKK